MINNENNAKIIINIIFNINLNIMIIIIHTKIVQARSLVRESCFDNPKSPNLTVWSFVRNMFEDFISRCKIFFWCISWSPNDNSIRKSIMRWKRNVNVKRNKKNNIILPPWTSFYCLLWVKSSMPSHQARTSP